MSYAFTFDPQSAKKADDSGLIDKTGKYYCWIIDAEFITSKNGAKGILFDVISKDKEKASFAIYYEKADGTPIFGKDRINAMLACMGIKTLTAQPKVLKRYDFEAGGLVDKQCMVAPELHKQKIGLLLQRENYVKQNGTNGYDMKYYSCFQFDTELMAKEVLDGKTQPEALPKVLERLINLPTLTRQATTSQSHANKTDNGYTLNQGFVNPKSNDDLDDGLPF